MDKDIERFIYCAPFGPEEEKLFEAIEAAIGFKLFVWQKTYILTGKWRRFGKTTAECIRELIYPTNTPIDYSDKPRNMREDFHRRELRRIQEKLSDAGIKTRQVLWNKRDKYDYEKRKRQSDGFNSRIILFDEKL